MSSCTMQEFFCIRISLAYEQTFFIPFTGTSSADEIPVKGIKHVYSYAKLILV